MKNKKACMPFSIFYFLFYFEVILIIQYCFLFFSQFGSQSEAEKLPSSNKKNVIELSSKEKVLEQKEKKRYFMIHRR